MTLERRLPRVGSALLVELGDRVLLGVRNKEPNRGKWVLPGGGVEPFESVKEAARREIAEETGLVVEVGDQIGVFEIIEPPNEHRLIVYSWATPVHGDLRADSDVLELRFVDRTELSELELSPIVKEVLVRTGWLEEPEVRLEEVSATR